MRAVHALEEAQKIAFAPFVFQATMSLKRLGVFDRIFERRSPEETTLAALASALDISEYGLGVLLEIAESSDIVEQDENGSYELTKIGYFLNFNRTAEVNMNFTQDVCYQGLFHLTDSIKTGKPAGLKELGNWDTIYEGLSQMEPHAQKAWFDFDHHYSDDIFQEALKIILDRGPKKIHDVGGNTGKFAIQCCQYDKEVSVKIFDLPGQLNKALNNAKKNGLDNRISGQEIDWLSANPTMPEGADTIWLCQFLDCFSEEEIEKVLSTCAKSMDDEAELIIIETFTDRQKFDNAKFILEATSLYFTALANGNSKMYPAKVFEKIIKKSGLEITQDIALGEYHTMFRCKIAS